MKKYRIRINDSGYVAAGTDDLVTEDAASEYSFQDCLIILKMYEHAEFIALELVTDPPTFDDLLREMQSFDGTDPVSEHREADGILCEALKLFGQTTLVEAFERLEKWYP